MRKEQILLLVAVGIGALLVWGATGKYTEVNAANLPAGKDVPVVKSFQPDPTKGLSDKGLKGRALSEQVRPEKRPPLPELPVPAAPAPWFVLPIPSPGPNPEHWRTFRKPMVTVKAPEPEVDPNATPPVTPEPEEGLPTKKFALDKQAKLVRVSGEELYVRLELTGQFKGQPEWVILEKWPNVTFKVGQFNTGTASKPSDGTIMGSFEITKPEDLAGYKTVHLMKTLENEFHEERIGRGVRDDDRDGLVKFAKWVFDTLPPRTGVDLKDTRYEDPTKYGLAAIRLAIGEVQKARALSNDLTLTKLLGDYYRAAYDLEGELKVYLDYMNGGRQNDTGTQLMVGGAYERAGALVAAKELYEKASQTGDAEAKLRLGIVNERLGRFDDAIATLRPLANIPGVGGQALVALTRISLALGRFDDASGYAQASVKEGGPVAYLGLGAVQYAQGKYAEAEKSFMVAREDDRFSTWRSNHGFALIGTGALDDAQKEFNACLDSDPLNLLDPLFGLGDVFQRRELQRSNDYFETAKARSPDNAWILLRLGTIWLRDGQAQKALEMGLHLLDVAPGCNEGLWLVGRAAASLATPDFEKAIAHLKRAVAKEPDNRDFLLEYARALVLGGRLDDALKVLDAATNVQTGPGRTDARLLALLSWARFLAKRPIVDVFEAIERGKRAQPDEATKEWLTTVRKMMDDWDRTRIWEDSFDRPPAGSVGNGWNEKENNGINIGLNAGHAVFISQSAKQAAATREDGTRLDRNEDLGRVKIVEASFKASQGAETIFHMFIGALPDRGAAQGPGRGPGRGGIEIGLGCDRTGSMELWITGARGGTQGRLLKDSAGAPRQWPMDDFHTVRFLRKDDTKGIYEIWLDDEKIADPDTGKTTFEVGAFSAQPGKMFGLGFLVDTDTGGAVDVEVDWVRVTKTTNTR